MSQDLSIIFKNAKTIKLQSGHSLFRAGDKVARMYFVVNGKIDLIRHLVTGERMILHRATHKDVLAEASLYSSHYHCEGVASSQTELLHISTNDFNRQLINDSDLSIIWSARLAHALQQSRINSEIRSLRTVKSRVDAWLSINRTLPTKGNWQHLAETLGVTPEALYRELAKRRKTTSILD